MNIGQITPAEAKKLRLDKNLDYFPIEISDRGMTAFCKIEKYSDHVGADADGNRGVDVSGEELSNMHVIYTPRKGMHLSLWFWLSDEEQCEIEDQIMEQIGGGS